MCLHPSPVDPVPEQTAHVARAAFPKGNTYLRTREELGAVFEDENFAALFPTRGKPALPPWRLALVPVMQFAEGLSDRQAAHAVWARIDWKFALSLELTDPGFDASVLCEFRSRLARRGAQELLFDLLFKRLRERGLLKARGRQRTDSTHVLAAVRDLNRLELVGETVRPALNALAVAAPKWLSGFADPGWAARYERPLDEGRLPTGKEKRRVEAERIGENGSALLEAVGAEDAPRWLRELPAVETLRRVWLQNYLRVPGGDARWRRPVEDGLPPASERIDSPTDPESRRACKGRPSGGTAARWLGYKVHLTETCDDGMSRLVTHVETHTAPTPDQRTIPAAYEALEARKLLPHVHLVDMGYTDAAALLQAREGTEWTCWDRCGATTGGTPERAPASAWRASRPIGRGERPPVPRARRASTGAAGRGAENPSSGSPSPQRLRRLSEQGPVRPPQPLSRPRTRLQGAHGRLQRALRGAQDRPPASEDRRLRRRVRQAPGNGGHRLVGGEGLRPEALALPGIEKVRLGHALVATA